MLLRDDTRNRWFLVMRQGDANRPGSAWFRVGAASRGKLVVRPIRTEGWLSLGAFVIVWAVATIGIWAVGFHSGAFSLAFAVMMTVLVGALAVVGFWRLVCTRMTTLPP
jgi:hypothetical protein